MIRHEATVERITPDYARRVAEEEGFHSQRKKSWNHTNFLVEVMKRGEFDGGEPIRFAAFAGSRFLVNGQHRLDAIAESGIPQDVVVVTSHCDSAEEVAHIYARIDRGRGRNVADALQALGMVENGGLNSRQLMATMACAPLFANDLRSVSVSGSYYVSKSAEGRMETMAQWMPAAKRYFAAISGATFGNDREFYRREVVAVGIATFGDQPASSWAEEFWRGAASDNGLNTNDPRKQCLEFLKKQRERRTSYINKGIGLGYIAHGVAACWSAWMRDSELRMVKVLDPRAPLRILGTRFAKRHEDGSLDTSPSRTVAATFRGYPTAPQYQPGAD